MNKKDVQREPPQLEGEGYNFYLYDWMAKLSSLAKKEVYALIYSHYINNQPFHWKRLKIAKFIGVTERTIGDALKELRNDGYILCVKDNSKTKKPNWYEINEKFLPIKFRRKTWEKNSYDMGKNFLRDRKKFPMTQEKISSNNNIYNNNYNNNSNKVASESERDKLIQDNLPSKNENDSMNEEVSQILNLYQEINPKFTPNDIERLIALTKEYPSNSIKKSMEKAKSRNTTSIGYIEKVLRNPITAKDTDKKDISPIDFVESNPVMKKCYDSLSELYIPSKQEEYSTCKELIKLWTNEQGNIKPETEIETITERIKKAIEFFLPEYKQKMTTDNKNYVPYLHNFIARAKWKDAERQQQVQSAPKESTLKGFRAPTLEEASRQLTSRK